MTRDIPEAVAALEHLIDHCKARQLRSFKGDLLGPDGTKLWSVEMTFERAPEPKRNRDEE